MGLRKKIERYFENKSIVLMYHRVAEVDFDPWQLCVSERNFEEQLQVLQNYEVLPQETLSSRLSRKKVPSKGISITFDDGYEDNYRKARPLLRKYSCPATFFITSSAVNSNKQFWWDELESIILYKKTLPLHLNISINNQPFEFRLSQGALTSDDYHKQKSWYWPAEAVTPRCDLYLKLWEKLKPLQIDEINRVLADLRSWSGHQNDSNARFTITSEELIDLNSDNLFSIGAHTVSHPALGLHSKAVQHNEIVGSQKTLHHYCNKAISTISYPYGNFNTDTISVAAEQKFSSGFTTMETAVTNRTEPLQIGRFQVNNWNGEKFEEQLTKWFKTYED